MKPDRTALDYLELFRSGHWFRSAPADFQERLLGLGVLRSLKPGQHLFSQGDGPYGFHGVVEGSLRVRALGASGREALIMFLKSPSWLGEIGLFDGLPTHHDGIADEPTLLVSISQASLLVLLREQPAYWLELGRLMARRVRHTVLALDEAALHTAPIRLARRLLLMAQNYGDLQGHSSRVLDMNQEELATMLCISRQTTNQLLKQLEAQGLVSLRYGQIELLDLERLRALVDGEQ